MKKSSFQNMMLIITCLLIANCFALATSSLHSQVPQGIPYQAMIRDNAGAPLVNTAVTVRFTLHQNSINGAVEYQETQALTTNGFGLINTQFGHGTAIQGSFAGIVWSNTTKFIQVEANDGSGYVDMGTQQMMSVPYAMYSGAAASANMANSSNTSVTAENGFSNVSATGDTLYMANGSFIIVPGISAANYQYGCTDAAACNYDATVELNNGTCLYLNATCDDGNANTINDVITAACLCQGQLLGCTNPQSCNFNPGAVVDDGSCLYQNATCDDGNANTINDVINGGCVCAGTAVGSVTFIVGNGATDIDGNTYTSIIINGQEWMQQNLAVTKYRNGDPIPTGLSNTTWQNTTNGAYAIYNNDPTNDATYGKLYNWFTTVDSRGLCPTGWHVPSDAEWSALINYLDPSANGGDTWPNVAGGKLKSTTGWNYGNEGATNESGFTGLPGGYRFTNGSYYGVGYYGYWWSSTEVDSDVAWDRRLYYDDSSVVRTNVNKHYGFSVRCVRD